MEGSYELASSVQALTASAALKLPVPAARFSPAWLCEKLQVLAQD